MEGLFNVLNFSIHCKIFFISRQNNCVYVLLKYIKSLGSPQCLLCFDWDILPWRGSGISPPGRFFFSEIVYTIVFGRCENRSECVVDIKEGCWIFLIVSKRKVKK